MPGIEGLAALEAGLVALGLSDLRRIVGGWQSLAVYDARLDGLHVAVKVLDPGMTDRAALDARVDVVARLGAASKMVCAPVHVGGRFVNDVAGERADPLLAVAYEFAEGDAPDIDAPDDAASMGRALAELHATMAALPAYELPGLAAFSRSSADGPRQLLHGDLSSKNVRFTGRRWRVFDFDDCGYGPVELDLAHSLYFVLFDAMTGDVPDRYRRFRDSFLGGYRDQSGVTTTDAELDTLITQRVLALASWLADPDTAPPGIRTASDEWRMTLGAFVQQYLGGE